MRSRYPLLLAGRSLPLIRGRCLLALLPRWYCLRGGPDHILPELPHSASRLLHPVAESTSRLPHFCCILLRSVFHLADRLSDTSSQLLPRLLQLLTLGMSVRQFF